MAAPKGGLIPYFFSRPIAIIILLVIIGFAMVPVLKCTHKKTEAVIFTHPPLSGRIYCPDILPDLFII